ncbi:MAG TPA: hypothetical protein VFE23_19540 [Usitatibacter sp.]|jgi:hypothetical protein|nr:hypothetical protein [Usitatibacter sp.]
MNTLRKPVLLAGALVLASAPALAGQAKPFEADFDKCFTQNGPGAYVFTFSGPVTGDVSGHVDASVLNFDTVQQTQTYIQADYFVTGSLPFTARVGGRAIDQHAVLRGFVSAGPEWLIGAGVHDEFVGYTRADGVPCAKGTLYITPRWKQTHDDDND